MIKNAPDDMPDSEYAGKADTRMVGDKEYVLCNHPDEAIQALFMHCPRWARSKGLPYSKEWAFKVCICRDCLYFVGELRPFLDACFLREFKA